MHFELCSNKNLTPEVSGISGMIRFHNENIPNIENEHPKKLFNCQFL